MAKEQLAEAISERDVLQVSSDTSGRKRRFRPWVTSQGRVGELTASCDQLAAVVSGTAEALQACATAC